MTKLLVILVVILSDKQMKLGHQARGWFGKILDLRLLPKFIDSCFSSRTTDDGNTEVCIPHIGGRVDGHETIAKTHSFVNIGAQFSPKR